MRFPNAILAAATLATATLAAPVADTKSMTDTTAPQWTIESFTRTCDAADTQCSYFFAIDPHTTPNPTACAYNVTGSPASTASYGGIVCGAYTVSSSHSDQFGADAGFSTLAVTNGVQIIYPAYTDAQLASNNGTAVSPDQSYAPQNLP